MGLFSSTHKTTAFSGGFKYSPTISRTFSTKNGSVDSLKCFCRCGCKPKACQIRCTVDLDMRLWDAICRTLQCVPSLGLVSSVLRTNCATRSSLIGRGRPGRNSSCKPATSCSRKRCRHLPTVALVNPNWRAISMFVFPEALSKIILARLTNPDGRERDLANDSNCSRCSAPNTNAAFGRPIAIGTSIVHKRCPSGQQYYCHLLMGHYTRRGCHSEQCEESGSCWQCLRTCSASDQSAFYSPQKIIGVDSCLLHLRRIIAMFEGNFLQYNLYRVFGLEPAHHQLARPLGKTLLTAKIRALGVLRASVILEFRLCQPIERLLGFGIAQQRRNRVGPPALRAGPTG